MKKILVYTFRTYPRKEELREICGSLAILGSLKNDVNSFCTRLLAEKPEYILGIANTKKYSVIESMAVNEIHGKMISKEGEVELKLFIPSPPLFNLSSKSTNSFCNYSMYKIADFIKINCLDIRLVFVHLNARDSQKLNQLKNILLD